MAQHNISCRTVGNRSRATLQSCLLGKQQSSSSLTWWMLRRRRRGRRRRKMTRFGFKLFIYKYMTRYLTDTWIRSSHRDVIPIELNMISDDKVFRHPHKILYFLDPFACWNWSFNMDRFSFI
jgi:hypothetical protein